MGTDGRGKRRGAGAWEFGYDGGNEAASDLRGVARGRGSSYHVGNDAASNLRGVGRGRESAITSDFTQRGRARSGEGSSYHVGNDAASNLRGVGRGRDAAITSGYTHREMARSGGLSSYHVGNDASSNLRGMGRGRGAAITSDYTHREMSWDGGVSNDGRGRRGDLVDRNTGSRPGRGGAAMAGGPYAVKNINESNDKMVPPEDQAYTLQSNYRPKNHAPVCSHKKFVSSYGQAAPVTTSDIRKNMPTNNFRMDRTLPQQQLSSEFPTVNSSMHPQSAADSSLYSLRKDTGHGISRRGGHQERLHNNNQEVRNTGPESSKTTGVLQWKHQQDYLIKKQENHNEKDFRTTGPESSKITGVSQWHHHQEHKKHKKYDLQKLDEIPVENQQFEPWTWKASEHSYVDLSHFITPSNPCVDVYDLCTGEDRVVTNGLGSHLLSSLFRYAVKVFNSNRSWMGRFDLGDLIVTIDKYLLIRTRPLMIASPHNLLCDLRRIIHLILPFFRKGSRYAIFILHLKFFIENPPESVFKSPVALKMFLKVVLCHPSYARPFDTHYLVIGIATAFRQMGTHDQEEFRRVLAAVKEDLKIPSGWDWAYEARNRKILSDVYLYAPQNLEFNNFILSIILLWRHSEIHGPQYAMIKCPIPSGEESQEKDGNVPESLQALDQGSMKFFETIQTMRSPIEILYMLGEPYGTILAQAVARIMMDLKLDLPAYIELPLRTYSRDESDDDQKK